jgi:hypothetical protein
VTFWLVRRAEKLPKRRFWWESIYFHHIGKTAGTSYRTLLECCVTAEQICPASWLDRDVLAGKLARYRLFRGHFPYVFSGLLPSPCAKLTVLRNPREHFLSTYNHLARLRGKHIALAHRKEPLTHVRDALGDEQLRRRMTNMQTFSLGWNPALPLVLMHAAAITDNDINNIHSECLRSLQFVHYGDDSIDRCSGDLLKAAIERLDRDCAAFGLVEEEKLSVRYIQMVLFGANFEQKLPRKNQARQQQTNVVTWDDLTPDEKREVDSLTSMDAHLYETASALLRYRLANIGRE